MSTLEKLVPPLELCKLIPEGKFADSVFCWCEYNSQEEGYVRNGWRTTQDIDGDFIVAPRFSAEKNTFCHRENFKITRNGWHCPAPTLAEILEALPTSISESKEKFYLYLLDTRNKPENDWQVGYAHEAFYGLYCSKKRKARDTNPATAALKLFLGMEARR